ncbi:DUF1127 domain-containing protein [Bradyrhizobium erythrophlei]|uniref:DUF1127 domain-containing protein n=1 Tax=Bradyrhizobium erythrophlei TaxID=1437360 RepID=UPI0035EF9375
MGDFLIELARYLTASPHSRIRRWAALRELDDHLLRDIGLSRCEVERGRCCAQGEGRLKGDLDESGGEGGGAS